MAGPPAFRFYGSAGDEGQWRTPRETSPLNPGNFLNLKRATNAADLTAFADVAFPSHTDKLHAKLRASSVSADTSSTRLTVGELYWQHSVGSTVDITVGRKIEKWGTGYAWNPTGFVNPRKDPSDPTDRLSSYRGLDMVELGVVVRGWSIAVIALPRATGVPDRTSWAARAYHLIGGTDLSLVARGGPDIRSGGISMARVFGSALELHAEAAWTQNLTRMVPASGALVARRADVVQVLVGGQYTFPHDLNLVAEVFHDGSGYSAGEWDAFRASADDAGRALTAGNPLPLLGLSLTYDRTPVGRDYAFQRLWAPLADDRFELEAIGIENLRDTSGLLRFTATWKIRRNLQVYAIDTEFWGSRSSEFHYLQVRRLAALGLRLNF